MATQTNKEACKAYQGRKRDREAAADRRRTAARTRRQSKRLVPDKPVDDLADWCKRRLKVPVGHALAGKPLVLPKFAVDFLRKCLQPDIHTGWMLLPRKNGKSASISCYVLGSLCDGGPLRRPGFRCAIVSITKEKANELKTQAQNIAEASGLRGLSFPKSPAPGRIVSRWGVCDILSAADYSGHSGGWDVIILDEPGLLSERYRPLIAGLKSSLTAKRGRMICLSIVGDSPFTQEAISLKGHPGVVVHHYAGEENCAIDDPEQLRKANPGIESGILHLEDLVRDAELVKKIPANESYFRAHHLNQRQSATKELICSVSDWTRCLVEPSQLPPRTGPAFLGFDPGGSASLCAACCIWSNGRAEFFSAFPGTPDLATRASSDGAGGVYQLAASLGQLRVYAGRVTPTRDFLAGVIHSLAGVEIEAGASDQYRRAETEQLLDDPETGVDFSCIFRRMGAGPTGGNDLRAFQKMVLRAELKTEKNILFAHGLSSAVVARDGNGNPSLLRSGRGRIDLVSAACLASGLRSSASGDDEFSVTRRAVV